MPVSCSAASRQPVCTEHLLLRKEKTTTITPDLISIKYHYTILGYDQPFLPGKWDHHWRSVYDVTKFLYRKYYNDNTEGFSLFKDPLPGTSALNYTMRIDLSSRSQSDLIRIIKMVWWSLNDIFVVKLETSADIRANLRSVQNSVYPLTSAQAYYIQSTLYIGRPKSKRQARIYNKRTEMLQRHGTDIGTDITRFEVRQKFRRSLPITDFLVGKHLYQKLRAKIW